MQHAGMHRARRPLQGQLQHPPRLRGVRAGSGLAGPQVPQLPRRHVHQRVREQGGDVEVARVIEVGLAHGPDVALVPCRRIHRRRRRRVAGGDRGDERLLGRGRAAGAGQRPLGRRERLRQRRRQIGGVEGIPRLVVVRAGRVGHPPVGHGAAGVGLDGPLEAADRLLVIERVRPDEPPVEPRLRIRRRGPHRPVVASEVEVAGHARISPAVPGPAGLPPPLPLGPVQRVLDVAQLIALDRVRPVRVEGPYQSQARLLHHPPGGRVRHHRLRDHPLHAEIGEALADQRA